jgi:hypothetical protein
MSLDAAERDHYATDVVIARVVIARVGYMAVRELEMIHGADIPEWDDLEIDRQEDYIAGVHFIFAHPTAPNSAQHDAWLARNAHRLAADDPRRGGYDKLGYLGKLKVALWRNICHAFVG